MKDKEENVNKLDNVKQKKLGGTVTSETINLIKYIRNFGVDIIQIPYRSKKGSLELKDLPLTPEQLQEIQEKFGLAPDFKIGNRMVNIMQAIKKKTRISVTEEEKEELKKLGAFDKKVRARREYNGIYKNMHAIKIEMFEALSEAGIDVSIMPSSYTDEDKKSRPTQLDMIGLDEQDLKTICEKFEVPTSLKIGRWKAKLKRAYREGKLTPEEEEKIEDLEIITEIDKLEMEHEQEMEDMEDFYFKFKESH